MAPAWGSSQPAQEPAQFGPPGCAQEICTGDRSRTLTGWLGEGGIREEIRWSPLLRLLVPLLSPSQDYGESTEWAASGGEFKDREVFLQKSPMLDALTKPRGVQARQVLLHHRGRERVRKDSGLSRLVREGQNEPALPAQKGPTLCGPTLSSPGPTWPQPS